MCKALNKQVYKSVIIKRIVNEKVFLISRSLLAETHTPRAAIKTIKVFKSHNIIEYNHGISRLVIEQITSFIKSKNLEYFVEVIRFICYPAFNFYDTKRESELRIKTLMMQEIIKSGIMFQGLSLPYFSHKKVSIDIFSKTFSSSMDILKNAFETWVDKYLIGNQLNQYLGS